MLLVRHSYILLLLAMIAYLGYHMVSGEYSIANWLDNEPDILEREQRLQGLRERKIELENLTSRLSDEGLDLDLLEEEARKRLYYLEEGEVTVDLPEEQN